MPSILFPKVKGASKYKVLAGKSSNTARVIEVIDDRHPERVQKGTRSSADDAQVKAIIALIRSSGAALQRFVDAPNLLVNRKQLDEFHKAAEKLAKASNDLHLLVGGLEQRNHYLELRK